MDMPVSIPALVRKNNDCTYTIIINSRHSYERQRQSFMHELSHIKRCDFEKDNVQAIEFIAHNLHQKVNYQLELSRELSY